MEQSYGQPQRRQPEEPHYRDQPSSRIPLAYDPRVPRPPIQLAPPPRSYQHRQKPGYSHPRDSNARSPGHPNQHAYRPPAHLPNPTFNQSQQYDDFQAPQPVFREPNRHLSHISALSSSQASPDSRPVSEAQSQYTSGPARNAKDVDSEIDNTDARSKLGSIAEHLSLGSTLKQVTTTVEGRDEKDRLIRDSQALPVQDQSVTIEALTNAIKQGLDPSQKSSQSSAPQPPGNTKAIRMPFQQGEPGSPTSIYTDVPQKRHSIPMSSYQGFQLRDSEPSTRAEQETDDYEKSNFAFGPPTPMSHTSSHPIIGDEKPRLSADVPATKRPRRLDMGAVREAEARGSITSLSDLIRRATRLASNLDRGRTASRVGHLNIFGSTDEISNRGIRASTYSDVLAAFPVADGTSTPGKDRPDTMWPNGEKQFMTSKSSLGRFMDTSEKPKRKCCGLSPPIFVLLLVVAILLIAAAVLVPVFLVVIPNHHRSVNTADCPLLHQCHNNGVSVLSGGACSCVCVDGFTSSDCSAKRDTECVTASFTDGTKTYNNATVGSSVLPILQGQQSFDIPLNVVSILSTFARNNLSCVSENSLVRFDTSTSQKTKRFVMLPGLMTSELHEPALELPASELIEYKRFVMVDGVVPAAERLQRIQTRTLQLRQDATQSANGIVFATSTTSSAAPAVTAAADPTVSTSATPSSATSPATSSANVTDTQRDFAATVVLYVLMSNEISVAVGANQAISSYFQMRNKDNNTVVVVGGSQRIDADFETFKITFANGTMMGGNNVS